MRKGPLAFAGALASANAMLMLVALKRMPYSYYQDLRLATLFLSAVITGCLVASGWRWWAAAVAGVALLYNPIAPLHFPRATWRDFNIATALLLVTVAALTIQQALRHE